MLISIPSKAKIFKWSYAVHVFHQRIFLKEKFKFKKYICYYFSSFSFVLVHALSRTQKNVSLLWCHFIDISSGMVFLKKILVVSSVWSFEIVNGKNQVSFIWNPQHIQVHCQRLQFTGLKDSFILWCGMQYLAIDGKETPLYITSNLTQLSSCWGGWLYDSPVFLQMSKMHLQTS